MCCSQQSSADFQSSGQEPFCSVVKRSSCKSDGQDFSTLVLAVNTVRMRETVLNWLLKLGSLYTIMSQGGVS